MDIVTAEMLDECIHMVNQLLNLQDEDSMHIANGLQGDQLLQYQKIMHIEQEKLQQLKNRLHALGDAFAMLPQ